MSEVRSNKGLVVILARSLVIVSQDSDSRSSNKRLTCHSAAFAAAHLPFIVITLGHEPSTCAPSGLGADSSSGLL